MKTIEVSDETYAALEAEVRGFKQTPETVIRRLLSDARRAIKPEGWPAQLPPFESADFNLEGFICSAEFSGKAAKEKYLSLLEFLWREKSERFTELTYLKFGKRVQVATSREKIEQSGRSTKPEAIGKSGYWALTNLSNRSKRDVLARCMQKLGYTTAEVRLAVGSIPDTHPFFFATHLL